MAYIWHHAIVINSRDHAMVKSEAKKTIVRNEGINSFPIIVFIFNVYFLKLLTYCIDLRHRESSYVSLQRKYHYAM